MWLKDWVVHCQPVGPGLPALKYLAPYIFRVALSNRRILKRSDTHVTFQYRATETGNWRRSTVTIFEFMRRFLQHVLPKGFAKVRYFGWLSVGQRPLLQLIRLVLPPHSATADDVISTASPLPSVAQPTCPHCFSSGYLDRPYLPHHFHPTLLRNRCQTPHPVVGSSCLRLTRLGNSVFILTTIYSQSSLISPLRPCYNVPIMVASSGRGCSFKPFNFHITLTTQGSVQHGLCAGRLSS